jgi:hypothetical protein
MRSIELPGMPPAVAREGGGAVVVPALSGVVLVRG